MEESSRAHLAGQWWSPAAAVLIDAGAASDPGPTRARNEDRFLLEPPAFVVADGMGGHAAGEIASDAVTAAFCELLVDPVDPVDADLVRRAVELSAERVALLERSESGAAPGTTMVAAAFVEELGAAYWCIASIGDSRAYLLEAGDLVQVSHDHSVVQELVDEGRITAAEARHHPERNVITRALGADLTTPADFSLVPVTAGARLLLCTDGVWGVLEDDEIAAALASRGDSVAIAGELVRRALAAGGRDNATALVLGVDPRARALAGDVPVDTTSPDGDTIDLDAVR